MLQRAPHAPELIAHRGMPRVYPENSLPGFAMAIEAGADGIELDVHAARDGVVVVHHDPVVRAPDGSGLVIADSSLHDLRAIAGDPASLPTLDDVLALVDGAARVYVEVKAAAMERLLVPLLLPRTEWCAVHSFDHRAIHALRILAPSIRCGVLMSSYLLDPLAPLRDTGAVDLWQHWSLIDEALVAGVHGIGGRVIAWTVNDAAAARTLREWGVDGLCTDDIRVLHPL